MEANGATFEENAKVMRKASGNPSESSLSISQSMDSITTRPRVLIIQANSVTLMLEEGDADVNNVDAFNGAYLVNFDMEDRRNLCDVARKYVTPLHFLHKDVAKAQPQEFVYRSGEKEIDIAIVCPTLPQLYLRRFEDKIQLLLLPSFVDDLEFEEENIKPVTISLLPEESYGNMLSGLNAEDRLNLCSIARRSNILSLLPFVEDTNAEANTYSFEYPSGGKIPAAAIFCPAIPPIYLRLENSTTRTKTIITFLQNQADNALYTLELFEDVQPINNVEIQEVHRRKMETERHLFTTIGKGTMWNFCFVAQKYLLKMENIIFRFTWGQYHFWNPKLLLISKYMEEPRLYKLKRSPTVIYEDFIIKCSAWPEMYLRLGDSHTHIRAMLLRKSLVQSFHGEIIISGSSTSNGAISQESPSITRAFKNLFSLRETSAADRKKENSFYEFSLSLRQASGDGPGFHISRILMWFLRGRRGHPSPGCKNESAS